MVAFNDRRTGKVFGVDEVLPKVTAERGDTFGKDLINGRFLVHGIPTDEGRRYVVHEALPNGEVVTHDEVYEKRGKAKKAASRTSPTQTYDI